ncbi:unnamed protein product, partial [Prorocentrum cordatum]
AGHLFCLAARFGGARRGMATELEQRLAHQRARADAGDTGEPDLVVSLTSLSAAGRSRPDLLERTIEVPSAEGSAPSSQADLRRKLGSRRARVHRTACRGASFPSPRLAISVVVDSCGLLARFKIIHYVRTNALCGFSL